MEELKRYRRILEASEKYQKVPLPVKKDELAPVLSRTSVEIHYNVLYQRYIDKAIAGKDDSFVLGGIELHAAFFEQLQKPKNGNKPKGESTVLIIENFGDFASFKEAFKEAALSIQGSGWVYLSKSGKIKTIKDHKPAKDIAMILDMWEHAYTVDYGGNKEKYVNNFWRIINWEVVDARLE